MDESIWTTNIRGLISKFSILQHEIQHHQPSLITICESFLTPNVPDSALSIDNYSFFRRDRGSFGGGVIVYYRNSLRIQRMTQLEQQGHEAIWYKILAEQDMEIIGCAAYWPPSPISDLTRHIQETVDSINFSQNSLLLISGDLNSHHATFPCCTYSNASGASLHTLMCDNDLHQIVTQPTRIPAETKSCIDVILTNLPEVIHFESVLPGIGTSDHGIAVAKIRYDLQSMNDPSSPASFKVSFDHSSINWLLNNYYRQANWEQALQHQDIDIAWSALKDIIERGLRMYARVINKSNPPRQHPMRLSNEALQRKREMQNAWNQHRVRNTPQTYSHFASARNRYTQAVRAAKRAHDERIADQMTSSSNPKSWYKLCRRLYKGSAIRDSIPSLITSARTATSPLEKATALNKTFVSKASNTTNKVLPPLQTRTTKCLDSVEITRRIVLNILQQLDTTKAPGPDRIHNIVLKKCAASLCNPLTLLFQRSMDEGFLPSEWKLAEVTAIYKHKGHRNDPNNYRPISLTSSICKVMERIINNTLLQLSAAAPHCH